MQELWCIQFSFSIKKKITCHARSKNSHLFCAIFICFNARRCRGEIKIQNVSVLFTASPFKLAFVIPLAMLAQFVLLSNMSNPSKYLKSLGSLGN